MPLTEFEKEIDRSGTASVKWSRIQDIDDPKKWLLTKDYFGGDRILPMWVADMDFKSPEPVINALRERVEHGIYGYTLADDPYFDAVVQWMQRRHGWKIDPKWILTTAGVVPAIHMLIQALTERGDKVLVQKPVYYPFFSAISENKRELVSNSLIIQGDHYTMDFDDLKVKLADPKANLIILCNPHNPVGRVWSREELLSFGSICKENNVTVIADEIHGDLIFPGNTFIPFASLEDFGDFTITCTAPSKTFNLAGLQASNIIIENQKLRRAYRNILTQNGLMSVNMFGLVGCKAAYEHGDEWLGNLMELLSGHLRFIEDFFKTNLPEFTLFTTQGTYLTWFDCNKVEQDHLILRRKFLQDARIFLDDGFIFGDEGRGYQRLNFACPRSVLEDAMERMKETFTS